MQAVTRVAVRKVQLCVLLVLGSLCPAALAEGDCASLAVTALESLYCRVVAEDEGAGLPSLQDFRQNNSKIQSLLLKRRAAALGLEMPLAGKQTEIAPIQKDRAAAHSPPNDSVLQEAESYSRGSFERATIGDDLHGCSFEDAARSIRCGLLIYDLASNEPLSILSRKALDLTNRLGIASFSGDIGSTESVQDYLSDAYRHYIPKMLEIGLGAATLSFTEFDRAFHVNEASGVDFAERLEASYRLLRTDRLTLAVNTKTASERPADIASCDRLDEGLIVCDNVSTNWVFVRQTRPGLLTED